MDNFVDRTATYHSQKYFLAETALTSSLEILTNTLAVVQLKISALKQSIISSTLIVPATLSGTKEILSALHLAVCSPVINWSLVNKALSSFVSLTTSAILNIDSRRLLVKEMWQSDFFRADMMKILRSGSVQMSTSLESLNTIFRQFKIDLSFNIPLFNDLVNTLSQLQSPETIQKEKMLVLMINKYHSRQIGEDAIRSIHDFIFSENKTMVIASSTLELLYNLSNSNRNKQLFFTAASLSTALITTITNYKSNRDICYHGCGIVHYLTVDINNAKKNKTEGFKLLDAGVCKVLVKVKEAHISDNHINSLVHSILKYNMKQNLFSGTFDRREYCFIFRSILALLYSIGVY